MTQYWITPWGVQAGDLVEDPFDIPSDWTEVSSTVYQAALDAIHADPAAHKASVQLAACQAKKAVYDDLKASAHTVDWSEATFRALSGYTPGDC